MIQQFIYYWHGPGDNDMHFTICGCQISWTAHLFWWHSVPKPSKSTSTYDDMHCWIVEPFMNTIVIVFCKTKNVIICYFGDIPVCDSQRWDVKADDEVRTPLHEEGEGLSRDDSAQVWPYYAGFFQSQLHFIATTWSWSFLLFTGPKNTTESCRISRQFA